MPPFYNQQLQTTPSQRSIINLRAFLPSLKDLIPRSMSPPSLYPTNTLHSTGPFARTLTSVLRRQQADPSIIPSTYSGINAGPAPGTVVGIVLGSVGGFLLLLWLIYTCFNMGGPPSASYEEEIVRRRSHSPRRAVSSRSRSEVHEVQRPRTPPRREVHRETVILEEEPRRRRDDDIVEVIEEHEELEEHSPPRRSRRGSGRDSGGPDGYYRTVDPGAYGGGRAPARKISRR